MSGPRPIGIGAVILAGGLGVLFHQLGILELPQLLQTWPLVLVGLGVLHRYSNKYPGVAKGYGPAERVLAGTVVATGLALSFGFRTDDGHQPIPPPPRPSVPMAAELKVSTRVDLGVVARGSVILKIKGARIRLVVGDDDNLTATLATPVDAPESGAALSATASDGDAVVQFDSLRAVEAEVVITVPAAASIRGTISESELLSTIPASFDLEALASAVELTSPGPVRLTLDNGGLNLRGGSGAITIDAANSELRIEDCPEPITLTTRFSRVHMLRTTGINQITSVAGAIAARSAGPLRIDSDRTDLDLVDIDSTIELKARLGVIKLDEIAGAATLVLDDSTVDVEDTSAKIELSGTPRQVTLSRIAGVAVVRVRDTRFLAQSCEGLLDLEVSGGRARLRRNRGQLRLRGIGVEVEATAALEGSLLDLDIRDGNVSLTIPRSHLGVELVARSGAIVAPPGWIAANPEADPLLQRVHRGDGEPSIRVQCENGIIRMHDE